VSKYLEFSCGCRFPLAGGDRESGVVFDPSIENLRLDCPKTWELISEGNTKGCFQLESRLGQSIAQKTRPSSIEELAALVSIMRPGCMEAVVDGKTLTDHFIDRKHEREEVDCFHPALEPILGETYGILVYQEQAMEIAPVIAGFDLQEADILRKAIGKKQAGTMAKVKTKFLAKAKELGIVTEPQAEEIFGWIEKSQRYSFNKSHAVSYAINAYLSAYAKSHFSHEFFTSYLYYSKEKAKPHEEINELINNAKLMDIEVWPPDLRIGNKHFLLDEGKIYFGLSDIKNVGAKVLDKIKVVTEETEEALGKPIAEWTWLEFLALFSTRVNTTAVKSIISVGACSFLHTNRTRMLYEYDIIANKLSPKETTWFVDYVLNYETDGQDLLSILKKMVSLPTGREGAVANKKRLGTVQGIVSSLENPPYKLEDFAEWLAGQEEKFLGISITCTKVDDCDTSSANCFCKDIVNNNKPDYPIVAVQVDRVNKTKIKNGPNRGAKMAFITVSDHTCSLDCVAFSQSWAQYSELLYEGNTIMVNGKEGRTKDSLVIEKVWQI
jgi:DNA polymerase III alpha subunit